MTETNQKTEDKVRNNDKPPTKFKGRMTPRNLQKSQLEKLMAEPVSCFQTLINDIYYYP